MGPHLSIEGARDGRAVPLPQDLDAIAITTPQGTIYIDLAEQVQNMVLMRASARTPTKDVVRLILSPMESGRFAVGIIRTASRTILQSASGTFSRSKSVKASILSTQHVGRMPSTD